MNVYQPPQVMYAPLLLVTWPTVLWDRGGAPQGTDATSPWPPQCASDLPLTCKVSFYITAEVKGRDWENRGRHVGWRRVAIEKKIRERAGTKSRVQECALVRKKWMGVGALRKLTVHPGCLSHCASQLWFLLFLLCLSTGGLRGRTQVIMQGDSRTRTCKDSLKS